jgi:hypothetical protein
MFKMIGIIEMQVYSGANSLNIVFLKLFKVVGEVVTADPYLS